jgi:methionyl-tRNA formyltransferase
VPLDIVFFGTPQPAATTLEALLNSKHRVLAVVTAPDRPRGRGMQLAPSPVKARAKEQGLPVLQPPKLRDSEVHEELASFGADSFVVTAYGLIVPQAVLDIPKLGCFNVHFSLLPRFRGAAPVERVLIEGEEKTGITIIQMDARLDTGPVVAKAEEPIRSEDTAGSLMGRLAGRGAALMVEVLDDLESGTLHPEPQDDSRATYANKMSPDEARIDWTLSATAINNRIRAFNPRPGAWTMFEGKRLKVMSTEVSDTGDGKHPGEIRLDRESLFVGTGSGELRLIEVQPEGRGVMSAEEFVRGRRISGGEKFS